MTCAHATYRDILELYIKLDVSTQRKIFIPRTTGCCSEPQLNKRSAAAEMGDRLATIDMHRKLRGLCPFGEEEAESPSYPMSPGPRPTFLTSGILIYPAVWPQQTWNENWGCAPLGMGAGSPSNTMWPGPRPTSMPSFILIHPAVWAKNWRYCCAPFSGGAESPSNKLWPGPRPISVPNGILIHPAIWPQ